MRKRLLGLRDWRNYLLPLLMLLTVAVTTGALAWSYANDNIVLYSDAVTHLQIARRVVDNITPGAAQLGTSWLPLRHVLELPFIWNDHLWHSGLAGGIVSTVAAWGTVFFAFRLGEDLSGSKFVGFVVALLVLSNPNLLYMQTTPMNESLFICTILGSAHYLVRWATDYRDRDLVLAGLFGLATAFNRYEGWALILAQAVVVAIIAWRRGGWEAGEGLGLAYASLAGLAPLLWFAWNWVLFGSPFDFLTNSSSSRSNVGFVMQETAAALPGGVLPTERDLAADFHYYGLAVYHMMGPIVCFAAIVGGTYVLWQLVSRRGDLKLLALLSLAAPGLFTIYALYSGSAVIWVKELPPHGFFDVRYGLYLFPLMAGLVALLGRLPYGKLLVSAVLVAQLALLSTGMSVVAFEEPQLDEAGCAPRVGSASGQCVALTGAPQYLRENYDGGR
ncbi:MAG: hypothetical protein MUP14_06010, partial [Dehalococcoidia bacterium]|nr:hypothetical protein [Dehalococcoidia bacterium]